VAGAKTDKTMSLVTMLAWNLLAATLIGMLPDPLLDHLTISHHYAFSKVNFDANLPSIPICLNTLGTGHLNC
jgi:hypothetical protein